MKVMIVLMTLLAAMSSSAFAEKTNFSHSMLAAELGAVSYATPICIGGQCLSSLGTASLAGSLQFADDLLVVALSGSGVGGSTPTWTVSGGNSALSISVVKAIGENVDVQAGIASLSTRVDLCGRFCISQTDTGSAIGGGLDIWLDDAKKFASKISFTSHKYSMDLSRTNTIGFGLGYYVNSQNEIYGRYESNSLASSVSAGYAHHF
ncbi:MAG: hypothetical protein RL358_1830 [Pseudomonadota bacterium]|jgi:hypothetical protein